MEEERDTVVLVDEEGEEEEFVHLDTFEMDNNEYVVLIPAGGDTEEDDETEIVILRVTEEDGDEAFESIDNEQEMDSVFEAFKMRLEQD